MLGPYESIIGDAVRKVKTMLTSVSLQIPVLAQIGMLPWRSRVIDGALVPSAAALGPALRDEGVRRVLTTHGHFDHIQAVEIPMLAVA